MSVRVVEVAVVVSVRVSVAVVVSVWVVEVAVAVFVRGVSCSSGGGSGGFHQTYPICTTARRMLPSKNAYTRVHSVKSGWTYAQAETNAIQ